MMFRRIKRREITPAETAANAAAKKAREAAAMTCQCCARKFLANLGTVAHHGYERPGTGWQTASCMGAKYLPFEVDRDKLGMMIEAMTRQLAGMKKHRAEVKADKVGIDREWKVREKVEGSSYSQEVRKSFTFTSRNFNEPDAIAAQRKIGIYGDWHDFKKSELASRDRKIKNLTDYIAECQARYDGWKQTHRWGAKSKTWMPIK